MIGSDQSLLSLARAAGLIGVSPHTLRFWLRQRRLTHVRLGRRILFDPQRPPNLH
jgi:excisionase family DNA binding protein